MSAATQAMQRDDAANPAWLWVEEGRQRFAAQCARCHEVAAMAGVAARYPAWDERLQRPLTLGQRITDCHGRHVRGMGDKGDARATDDARPDARAALPPEDETRLALETFVALQSRGRPIAPPADARLAPWRERGRALFAQRMGQLDLSCAQCHEQYAGRRLAGSVIPQGHPTGYPIYRLEWQGLGSLQRRLRGCLVGVRAEPFAADGEEATALEAFLMSRAAGLPMETPAVRP
ncbi:MAG: sulfur oxidation c-type cytochrome SoxA [Burkholderiales bacterium]|nr:sulfur oxidation c-type cytochrome SoxA [Burkholderiales bacterium]